jgi:predicted DNA-binding transcriptional regulator YafY
MATNKHATIRYHALDRCFSNFGRKFYIDDLVEACNEAIYDFSGSENGVKKRQVYDDIAFMESEQGWSIPIEKVKFGHKVYYRYSDNKFSIRNQGINQNEAEQLKETLSILSRFKGLPQFDWVEEIQVRLEETFKLKSSSINTVGFEQNQYLKGLNHFSSLFNSIQNQQVLKINYKSFKNNNLVEYIIHPWYLKQYNNRWFLFGFNAEFNSVSNLAIDRIESIEDSKIDYIVNNQINFDEYFDDVVGVSIYNNSEVEVVIIKASNNVFPYIESKPIHGSQRVIKKDINDVTIELKLKINHELMALLFSFMDAIEIMEPHSLRNQFKQLTINNLNKYQ